MGEGEIVDELRPGAFDGPSRSLRRRTWGIFQSHPVEGRARAKYDSCCNATVASGTQRQGNYPLS